MEFTSVRYRDILDGIKVIKPNYHLNYGKKRISKAKNQGLPFTSLASITKDVYTGGIFKRVFVENKEFGLPYISAQNMMNSNPREVAKLISKKYTPRQEDMVLKENQILVSCAGTIGNVRLITKDLEGIIGSQDIIRIIPENEKLRYGYLYAYLASPTAYNYMQSFIYGSVVPRIEPKMLSSLPIPLLKEEKQLQIHNLIIDASKLRVEANNSLKIAQNYFEKYLNNSSFSINKYSKTKLFFIKAFQSRFDANYNILFKEYCDIIKSLGIPNQKLSKFIDNIFIPNRGKRNYVVNGLKYLSTSDISTQNPTLIRKYISKNTVGLNTLKVEKDWLIIARSGQEILGSVFYVGESIQNCGINEHGLRLCLKGISPKYVFAFLSTDFGRNYIRSGIFGSAILTINDDFIMNIQIPLLEQSESNEVIYKTNIFIENYDLANKKETQAIELIENEISSWQK